MKVLFDHQIFATQRYGGISRYFVELAQAMLEQENIEAAIFAPAYINEYVKKSECLHPLSFRLNVPKRALRYRPSALQPLLDLVIKYSHPNILHETYYSIPSHRVARNMNIVTTVHDMIPELHPNWGLGFAVTARQKFRSLMRSDFIICVSENTRKDLIEMYPALEEKTATVYHGVNDTVATTTNTRLYAEPYILYVGVRAGYKNFDSLLAAVAHSSVINNNFTLLCFGGGPFTLEELKAFRGCGLTETKIIHMSGDDEELSRAYKGATLLVYPSLYEGFGMPLIEAMKHGCPVVCSNSSCFPEICGNAAKYFDPNDKESIRNALERLLGDTTELQRLSKLGLERSAIFSWHQCAEDTVSVYKRLAY